jgi:hypothetical protein
VHLILEDYPAKQEISARGKEKPVFYLMLMNNEYKDRNAIAAAAATPSLALQTAEFL